MPMTVLRRVDPWLWPLLLMGVIFFFSAQPSLSTDLGLVDLIGRKLIHFSEYALLCFLWWRVFARRLSPGRAALVGAAGLERLRRHRRVPPDLRRGPARHARRLG